MMRALIVDDEAPVRHLLRRWLERDGFEVVEAPDAEAALHQVTAEHAPAVVLADMRMPGRNGVWLAQQLRECSPETAVVMATGVHEFDVAVTSMQAGVVDYVEKPFARERVSEALQRAAAAHRTRCAQAELRKELQTRNAQVAEALADVELKAATTVDALLALVEKRDPSVRARARRVAELAVSLALTLGVREPRVSEVERAALLHDCDALALPEDVMARLTGDTTAPDGRAPTNAQIVDVARAYDSISWATLSAALPPADAVAALVTGNPEFDSRVLAALQTLKLSSHQ